MMTDQVFAAGPPYPDARFPARAEFAFRATGCSFPDLNGAATHGPQVPFARFPIGFDCGPDIWRLFAPMAAGAGRVNRRYCSRISELTSLVTGPRDVRHSACALARDNGSLKGYEPI